MSPPMPVEHGSVMFRPAATATAASWKAACQSVRDAGRAEELKRDRKTTNRCIASGLEDVDAALCCQRLRAGHNAAGAVHHAAPAGELLEDVRRGREHGRSWERHDDVLETRDERREREWKWTSEQTVRGRNTTAILTDGRRQAGFWSFFPNLRDRPHRQKHTRLPADACPSVGAIAFLAFERNRDTTLSRKTSTANDETEKQPFRMRCRCDDEIEHSPRADGRPRPVHA